MGGNFQNLLAVVLNCWCLNSLLVLRKSENNDLSGCQPKLCLAPEMWASNRIPSTAYPLGSVLPFNRNWYHCCRAKNRWRQMHFHRGNSDTFHGNALTPVKYNWTMAGMTHLPPTFVLRLRVNCPVLWHSTVRMIWIHGIDPYFNGSYTDQFLVSTPYLLLEGKVFSPFKPPHSPYQTKERKKEREIFKVIRNIEI